MLLFQCAAILALLAICSFTPGFFLVRRLRWGAMEKLCAAVALSLILLWLAAWTLYLAGAPPAAAYAVSAIALALGLASFRDLRDLLILPRVRHTLAAFAFLLAWTLLALCIIRVYNGASWSGDWLEHFQRSLFFLHHFPKDAPIFGNYLLPARPPAENVLAAFFLAQTADRFELFQIVFAFLNLLLILPCSLALPLLARSRRFLTMPLVALLACSPIVMQNATYTWTKLLTVFFVLTAILLYLRGWRRGDPVRIAFAFLCLAMGMLVHYSAGPYIVFFALHYLIAVLPNRPNRVRELAAIALTSGLLLFTWFAWSIVSYGVKPTFASNTSVTASQRYQGSTMGRIAGNVADSFLPHWTRDSRLVHFFDQPNQTAWLRDNIFVTYQVQLLFTMGVLGGPLVLWLLIRGLRRPGPPAPMRAFWLWLIASTVFLGLVVVGERDMFGSAHLTLLPMELLGLTLLAARFRHSRLIATLLIAGCVIDFSLGVFLHLRVQHLENTPGHAYFNGPTVANGQIVLAPLPDGLSEYARENWSRKHQLANVWTWRRQLQSVTATGKEQALAVLDQMEAEDKTIFRGWYARNGGQIQYLGDHFSGDIPSALLLIVFAGLLWQLWRALPPSATRAPIPAKPKTQRARARP